MAYSERHKKDKTDYQVYTMHNPRISKKLLKKDYNMKGIKEKLWLVVILSILITAVLVLGCCGDDNGEPGGVIVLKIGNDPDIFFAGSRDNVRAYYTPDGSDSTPPASTSVFALNGFPPEIEISFTGKTADTYSIERGEAMLSCVDASGNMYKAWEELTNTWGNLTIIEMGDVGEQIVGTFYFKAAAYDEWGPTGKYTMISGSFNVTRGSDY